MSLGPLEIRVTISRTAQLFYIVDQMSEWSPYCHRQYKAWAERRSLLGERERALLSEHKQLRAPGYGRLDQAFFTPLTLEDALSDARRRHLLDAHAIDVEQRVLDGLAPIVQPLIDEMRPVVDAFADQVQSVAPTLGRMLADFAVFADAYVADSIPLYLIANTDPRGGGGGFNGGFMQVEAGSQALPTLVHEALHVIMARRRSLMSTAAKSCGAGLKEETLHEGLAYALSPGILHAGGPADDPLQQSVDRYRAEHASAEVPYVAFNRYGLALRPRLESALVRKGTLAQFLPNACAVWKTLIAEPWP